MSEPPALVGEALSKRYRGRAVVSAVPLRVHPGEIVGLLGPNGAGKTTTFGMLAGLVVPDAGRVTIDGHDVSRLPMYRRARLGLGYLPQEASVFRKLTVRQNLLLALELTSKAGASERERLADKTLDEFGLSKVASSLGETLSGGERRRVEIARSLLPTPRYMLFDEPFAGVDPLNVAELQKEIAGLRARGLGVLVTDHNVRDTLHICDRAYVIAAGALLVSGSPQEIAASPIARAAYLGEAFALASEKSS